jgi:hypothetical protein
MAGIDVDTAALRAAADSIGDIASTFAATTAPAITGSSAQATTAAVNAVHTATNVADRTMAARLRSTSSAMDAGGTAFATTERASTEAVTGLTPGAG